MKRLLILALTFTVAIQFLPAMCRLSFGQTSTAATSIRVKGLKDSVTIRRDERGIPYIDAKNDEDLYFAQGYVTAQDRLWQMDLFRRNARGELSEVLPNVPNSPALDQDKLHRTLGFSQVVEAEVAQASPQSRAVLEAYAAGVNAYISTLDQKSLPPEFRILGYTPKPWTPADSLIVIVHYDSIGPPGSETSNPGADDDMTGMAILLETARLFVQHRAQLALTVRFVASDEEELGGLAGARSYAAYIKALSQSAGFALVAAVDDEQSGWNCNTDHLCSDTLFPAFDVFSCSRGGTTSYDFAALGDQFAGIVASYSTLHVKRDCIGANSDHFAMWEIGVPALVYSEHSPFNNQHFDQNGGDLFERLDTDYLISIARPGITFQASLAGIQK